MERNTVPEDDDEILKDGERRRVPMYLRDGWRNDMHEKLDEKDVVVTDAFALNRPGFRDCRSEAQINTVETAYLQADARDANAWRGNKPIANDIPEPDAGRQAAAEVLWRASAANFVKSMSQSDAMSAVYEAADAADRNAWRKGKE